FSLPSTKGDQFDLKKIKENVVIYFYPKDDTPGCTLETKDFSKLYKEFKKNKTEVVGISKDSMTSHLKFKKKYKVPFQLLSDEDVKVQKKYKVWGMKSFMGRKFKGTIRSTFLVDKNKKILKSWSNVRVLNHAKEVLEFLKEVK
ncbi:MAG: peroxiredoxin, partial [Pelagibacteraceae bacterium]